MISVNDTVFSSDAIDQRLAEQWVCQGSGLFFFFILDRIELNNVVIKTTT